MKCGGAEEWCRKAELYWYPLSQLRPWFEEALTAGQSDDRVAEHFRSMSHNAQHAQNRLQTQKYKDKPSIGLQRKGLTRPAWHAWALMGYRLEPDGARRRNRPRGPLYLRARPRAGGGAGAASLAGATAGAAVARGDALLAHPDGRADHGRDGA